MTEKEVQNYKWRHRKQLKSQDLLHWRKKEEKGKWNENEVGNEWESERVNQVPWVAFQEYYSVYSMCM